MEKIDCTPYGDGELSLWFFNDEGLYRAMRGCCSENQLFELARDVAIFTEDQWDELKEDWIADQEVED